MLKAKNVNNTAAARVNFKFQVSEVLVNFRGWKFNNNFYHYCQNEQAYHSQELKLKISEWRPGYWYTEYPT